jgi:hypothetical protein
MDNLHYRSKMPGIFALPASCILRKNSTNQEKDMAVTAMKVTGKTTTL